MATGDRFFGFDLIQRRTLADRLAEVQAGGGLTPEQTAALAAITALPTTDPGDGISVWNSNGVLRVSEIV